MSDGSFRSDHCIQNTQLLEVRNRVKCSSWQVKSGCGCGGKFSLLNCYTHMVLEFLHVFSLFALLVANIYCQVIPCNPLIGKNAFICWAQTIFCGQCNTFLCAVKSAQKCLLKCCKDNCNCVFASNVDEQSYLGQNITKAFVCLWSVQRTA